MTELRTSASLTASLIAFTALACTTPPSASNGATRWRQRLIEPLTQPTVFESPVIDSQLRPIVMLHTIPDDNAALPDAEVRVYALQARFALSDRLALIATKDGYIELEPAGGGDQNGWADIAGGLKYAFYEGDALLVTAGAVYEFANGDEEVLQGNGDGVLRPFVCAGYDAGAFNVLSTLGYNLPLDKDEESSSFDYHLHVSYELTANIAPLIELNGITWTDEGNALPVDFEGGDLINLGAANGSGSVLSGAVGVRVRMTEGFSLGAAYEAPLSSREDILNDRITLDAIWSF
jgi:hypothetical protein